MHLLKFDFRRNLDMVTPLLFEVSKCTRLWETFRRMRKFVVNAWNMGVERSTYFTWLTRCCLHMVNGGTLPLRRVYSVKVKWRWRVCRVKLKFFGSYFFYYVVSICKQSPYFSFIMSQCNLFHSCFCVTSVYRLMTAAWVVYVFLHLVIIS